MYGSQLDKPRPFLVATNRVYVNIAVIINATVLYILGFMYLLKIKLLLLLLQFSTIISRSIISKILKIDILYGSSWGRNRRCIFWVQPISRLYHYVDVRDILMNSPECHGVRNHRGFTVSSTVCSDANQRKHQSSASLAFCERHPLVTVRFSGRCWALLQQQSTR